MQCRIVIVCFIYLSCFSSQGSTQDGSQLLDVGRDGDVYKFISVGRSNGHPFGDRFGDRVSDVRMIMPGRRHIVFFVIVGG